MNIYKTTFKTLLLTFNSKGSNKMTKIFLKKDVKTTTENYIHLNQKFEKSCNFSFDTKLNTLINQISPTHPGNPSYLYLHAHTLRHIQTHTCTHLYNYIPIVRLSITTRLKWGQQFNV